MAKAKAKQADPSNGVGDDGKVALPEGFKSVRGVKSEAFYRPKPGTVVHGLLLGRYPKKGRFPGFYYQVRVFDAVECEVKIDGTDEYDRQTVEPGTVVSVDEKGGLRSLEQYADGAHEVFISCGKKRPIGDGQTAWDFDVGIKSIDPDSVPF